MPLFTYDTPYSYTLPTFYIPVCLFFLSFLLPTQFPSFPSHTLSETLFFRSCVGCVGVSILQCRPLCLDTRLALRGRSPGRVPILPGVQDSRGPQRHLLLYQRTVLSTLFDTNFSAWLQIWSDPDHLNAQEVISDPVPMLNSLDA